MILLLVYQLSELIGYLKLQPIKEEDGPEEQSPGIVTGDHVTRHVTFCINHVTQ